MKIDNNKEFIMSRFEQILKYLKAGGSGTDIELAKLFAKQHEPKRGAEIVRGAISALNKNGEHICKRDVAGQRKQQYYIPFAKAKSSPPTAILTSITVNGVVYDCYPRR